MEIPLTSFLDFVLKSGRPKMTCAKKIKAQLEEDYDPAGDYYKRFREAVQEMHKEGLPKADLPSLIGALPDTKTANYQLMTNGYKKFMGNKDVTWFNPVRKNWLFADLKVPVNPELGLEWDGTKYLIKLYLKAEKPSKDKVASILALMKSTLSRKDCKYALLDVRNSKLYLYESSMDDLIPLVEAEAQALSLMLSWL